MATTCTSCRAKAPMLAAVHADVAPLGVRVYSVSWDGSPGEEEELRTWKESRDQPWPHGIDPDFHLQRVFGITMQSSFVVLDDGGVLVRKWGYPGASEESLRQAIDEALARAAS